MVGEFGSGSKDMNQMIAWIEQRCARSPISADAGSLGGRPESESVAQCNRRHLLHLVAVCNWLSGDGAVRFHDVMLSASREFPLSRRSLSSLALCGVGSGERQPESLVVRVIALQRAVLSRMREMIEQGRFSDLATPVERKKALAPLRRMGRCLGDGDVIDIVRLARMRAVFDGLVRIHAPDSGGHSTRPISPAERASTELQDILMAVAATPASEERLVMAMEDVSRCVSRCVMAEKNGRGAKSWRQLVRAGVIAQKMLASIACACLPRGCGEHESAFRMASERHCRHLEKLITEGRMGPGNPVNVAAVY